jgi:hypothetical protein
MLLVHPKNIHFMLQDKFDIENAALQQRLGLAAREKNIEI